MALIAADGVPVGCKQGSKQSTLKTYIQDAIELGKSKDQIAPILKDYYSVEIK